MIGETVGPYRITRKIGEGGMGTVYAAEHALLGHQAAVKMLKPDVSQDDRLLQRFFNEARAAALAKHPSIIAVLDFGHHASGSAYIVMEYLEGEPLSRRLRRGPIREVEAARLGRQVASALEVAHARNVVHRDLKPDNIFLCPDPEVAGGERAKVLDFGIAKLAGDATDSMVKTVTGSVMGTPSYMAPEQARGSSKIDHRVDVYALGVVLFEMVTGTAPFTGEGAGEVIGKHIHVPAPDPRERTPALSPDMAAVILRCLEKLPEARFQSMSALGAALAACGAGEAAIAPTVLPHTGALPVTAAVAPTTMSSAVSVATRAPSRGGKTIAIAASVVIAIGGAAAAATWLLRARDAPIAAAAPIDAQVARADAARAVDAGAVAAASADAGTPVDTIAIRLTTIPADASVIDATGKLVGSTATPIALPRHAGVTRLVLRKTGYRDLPIAVPTNQASEASYTLVKLPQTHTVDPPTDPFNPYAPGR